MGDRVLSSRRPWIAGWALVLLALPACACGRGPRAADPGREARTAADEGQLLRAGDTGDLKAIRRLLDAGTPIEAVDGRGHTPLLHAARAGRDDAVTLLLSRGAKLDQRDYSGQSALVTALVHGQDRTARLLLEKGANANDALPPWSALRLAAFNGLAGAADALISRGADVNAPDLAGQTALMYAASRGHDAVVRLLLENGADVRGADKRGHTALLLAAGSGHAACVSALMEKGADARARNKAGQTAGELAALNGHAHLQPVLAGTGPAGPPAVAASRRDVAILPAVAHPGQSDEDGFFAEAARTAWRYVEAGYRPATGLVDASLHWPHTTMWDTGSAIAAHYCARELGLLSEPAYKSRMARTLKTLSLLPLYGGVTYDRQYSTRSVGPGTRAGWSPTDLGRLFLWLRLVAQRDPELAAAAEAVVRRTKTEPVLKQGFLWGVRATGGGRREFQEGRIGYEQYSAAGFAEWGLPVQHASVLSRYALPMRVLGQPVLADLRGDDRLTSDPLVLLGMEVGWTPEVEKLSRGVLAAQEERWRRSGRVTIVGEDAIALPPHFFYYYCVYTQGREFAVDVQDPDAVVSGPRWVSTKNAFAWHALLPSDYTRLALRTLRPAMSRRGWSSGVHEKDHRSTATESINTQAVILEAALFRKRRAPFLTGSSQPTRLVRTTGGESPQEEP